MESFLETLDAALRGLSSFTAGLGLFGVAFCDSSLLSLPEINDILLIYFGTRFSENAYYYALMSVLGSASGGSLLFGLARWKGYSVLEKKFSQGRIHSVLSLVRRFGVLAVLVPAFLPPPFPFKIFVLSAGALGLPHLRFLAAILAGRSIRYFGEAWLALRYGEDALGWVHSHSKHAIATGILVVALVVGVELFLGWRRQRAGAGDRLEPRPLVER
jgi:membrane protein YqaA with SNARE-associated domain